LDDVSFGNFGSKVLHAANVVAPIFGSLSGWLSAPTGGGRGLDGAPAWIIDRLKGWKIANPLITTGIAITNEAEYHLIADVVAGVTGLIIREVGDGVGISAAASAGSALLKFGSAAAINGAIAAWVYEAKNNPHGAEGGPSSGAGNAYVGGGMLTGSTSLYGGSTTINVDNPQGLAPMYAGSAPKYTMEGA
jgi:hypothetical protein